jgi:asparagine synthase (glutamine-hydrolysing)
MCGFAGVIQKEALPEVVLRAMAETIIHRGPDHTGYYRDDRAAFTHNRLSLVDLSENGHQPFVDDDHVLLYNGEIYNHATLRKKHLADGVFRSSSDTETLFHLLKTIGVRETCRLINGMFAFAWYDRRSGDLAIVRDRLGIKPLFYMTGTGRFVFSSELKAITQHFATELNRPVLMGSAIGELENTRTHTAFESVHQLEPGHLLEYSGSNGSVSVTRYFGLADMVDRDHHRELSGMPMEELVERFDALMCASVESMLMSDVGMGAFVSGGIDSSLIASIACRNQPIRMFTSNIVGKYSELPFSRMLSESIGQELHVSDFHPGDLVKQIVRTTWFYETPVVVHLNAIPFQGVAEMARRNSTKAVLTGEGSDELFLGYPRLLTRKWDDLIKFPYDLTTSIYKRIPGLTRYLNLNKSNHGGDLLRMPLGFMGESMTAEYEEAFSFVSDRGARADHILTLSMLSRGLHSLLWRNDRMGMMHSIESRFPFLDEELMKFAINLPIKAKIGRSGRFHNYKHPFLIDKHVVRKAAERYLPKALNNREKKGFPLFGFANIRVGKGFFKDGFLQDFYRLSERGTRLMEERTDPYLLNKMACVEIWGRLFARKEGMETVENDVMKGIRVEAPAS